MATSALALKRVLTAASDTGLDQELFLDVMAGVLRINDEDARLTACQWLYRIVKKIEGEVDAWVIDDETKAHIRTYIGPFTNLTRFHHLYMTLGETRGQFLSAQSLSGLININAALSGNFPTVQPDIELLEIAKEFREYSLEVHHLNLPVNVKKSLTRRLDQIASMLENYYFYGGEYIKDELDALTGVIAMNSDKSDDTQNGFFNKVAKSLNKTFGFIKVADESLGIADRLGERGLDLLSSIS